MMGRRKEVREAGQVQMQTEMRAENIGEVLSLKGWKIVTIRV